MARLRLDGPRYIVFTTELPVRVTDLNYGKHLGHMELVGLMHEARIRFLETLGMTELNADGAILLVVDLAVSYRAEAFLGDVLEIGLGIEPEGSRGLMIAYRVRRPADETTVAIGRTGVVFHDPTTRRLRKVPDALRELVEGIDL